MSHKIKQDLIVGMYTGEHLSMDQIAKRLGMGPSGVRYWLDKAGIKSRSISEAINILYTNKFGKKQFILKNHLSRNDERLKVAGIMLYWGEGSKTNNSVKFANSDPAMIKVFLKFLRTICGISERRMKALIHMYPDLNEEKLLEFWSKVTKIPKTNFYKSFVHGGKGGTYKNKSIYGTLAISYCDKLLLKQILAWIEEYRIKLTH
ncbi:MAG: hypothetical protein HYT12_04245 [Candidatus Liptonbacteria bacterium]|nr:hypothetical protein [Candidatus Liptonbacteria bacterium]